MHQKMDCWRVARPLKPNYGSVLKGNDPEFNYVRLLKNTSSEIISDGTINGPSGIMEGRCLLALHISQK